ncbi:hypothetical protein GKI01_16680 [Salmonella enterica]|nr:hypothetical protein [Salmonella enterica]EEA2460049.1 hypothetical protein [Salmonella enterica]EEA5032610.1 hypothetical protein [Salmonella enterica]EEA7139892.1 hypothetical protein [Salmonella enterica]EEB7091981.1 hypothetical protein [Salmonella enterica]
MQSVQLFKNEQAFLEYCRVNDLTGTCFLIHGYCFQWPLFTQGNFYSIEENFGSDKIFIEEGINKSGRVEVTVSDYIKRIQSGVKGMGNWSWQPHLSHAKSLNNSFTVPEAITLNNIEKSLVGELVLAPWILMSATETVTNMHQDMLSVNGIVGQLQGVKEFTLVAPQYALEEGKFYSTYELETLGIPFECVVLHPGDFLYFPAHWWHQAKTIECSVSFIHSTVNLYNMTAFLDDVISQMPALIQRVQSAAKKRGYFGYRIKWLCNGFRSLG